MQGTYIVILQLSDNFVVRFYEIIFNNESIRVKYMKQRSFYKKTN